MKIKDRNCIKTMNILLVLISMIITVERSFSQSQADEATKKLVALSKNLAADDIEEIRQLLNSGADANVKFEYGNYIKYSTTFLHIASEKGYIEIVKLLLSANANVNAATPTGSTPLQNASRYGHAEIVKLLLAANADVSAADGGKNSLLIASDKGYVEIVKLLLDAKADVNAAETNGMTSLIYASLYNHIEVVKLLLDAKADVNASETNGVTSLYYASDNGNLEMVQLLLLSGANPNGGVSQTRIQIINPLQIATLNGHTAIADEITTYLLKRHLNQNETQQFTDKVLKLLTPFDISDIVFVVQNKNMRGSENTEIRNDGIAVSLVSTCKKGECHVLVYHRTGWKSALDVYQNKGNLVLGFFDSNTNSNDNPFQFDTIVIYEDDEIGQGLYNYIKSGWSY